MTGKATYESYYEPEFVLHRDAIGNYDRVPCLIIDTIDMTGVEEWEFESKLGYAWILTVDLYHSETQHLMCKGLMIQKSEKVFKHIERAIDEGELLCELLNLSHETIIIGAH